MQDFFLQDGRAESCLPHYNQDRSIDAFPEGNDIPEEGTNEFRTVCMCFESSDNRNAPWPCYPTGRWHERRCIPDGAFGVWIYKMPKKNLLEHYDLSI